MSFLLKEMLLHDASIVHKLLEEIWDELREELKLEIKVLNLKNWIKHMKLAEGFKF